MRQKAHWDLLSATNYAREEGLKKGKQDIINMLKSGKSPEEIIREFDGVNDRPNP